MPNGKVAFGKLELVINQLPYIVYTQNHDSIYYWRN